MDFSPSSYPEQDKTGNLGYFVNRESTADRQQLREADLVSVRIGDVKEALAPWRISRRLKHQSLCLQRPVVYVHLIDSKNSSTPPPLFVSLTRYKVDEGFAGPQTAKGCTLAAAKQLESELPVEFNGTSHIADGECHCTDVPDHPSWSQSFVFR